MTNHEESSTSCCCPPGSWDRPLGLECVSINNKEGSPPQPQGKIIHLGSDLNCYYCPPPQKDSKLAVIVFHDVWGHIPRLKSICDTISEQGNFHTLAPDCFRGRTKDDVEDTMSWLKSHPYENHIANDISLCMEFLKSTKGVEYFGALGFCWGGWVIAKSASVGVPWTVGVSPHPSTRIEKLLFGRDEEEMLHKVHMPFLLLPAGNDPENLKPGSSVVQKLEGNGGRSVLFDKMIHGWTTRSDLTDPQIKDDVEKALSISSAFLIEHLKC